MSLPLKIGVGALTIGSISVATYAGIAYSNQGISINKLIEKEFNYILLDTSEESDNKDNSHWERNWQSYKANNTNNTENVFELNNWNNIKNGNSTAALKGKCKELSTKNVSNINDLLYKNVTKYCARGVTLEEQANKDGLTVLDTKGTSNVAIWTKRFESKESVNTNLEKLEIKGTISNGDAIKSGCATANLKNKQIQDYKDIYASYKLICVKQTGE